MNRTIVGLKVRTKFYFMSPNKSLNRTIVGLKDVLASNMRNVK
ncbi:protein of unknown function [Candidatus Nitrosocaldus cavascurensis]|uniref:Uncharacterized protein n=1 Tax=Candidatus Nitrosocaldus cavascurensis TaxID=2058097 RepID=A0A2K5ARH2_9ARCH|nr:protein of unknown function [Candidatus Nitrosocaldus cavascurensis]